MALWQPKLDPLQISCDKSCCEWLHTHFKKGPLKACLLVLIRITEELTAEEPKEPSSFRSHITPKNSKARLASSKVESAPDPAPQATSYSSLFNTWNKTT
ncbi:hypothetical protein NDU88_004248 [Pleurodeles waltl]|uniref:Uncharacterized protein n=1 Tax=Pleurodeles waltl TaxID=8319 RepID=A0AAV7PEL2_PLEWA|nr:hypothetical protein NDU88_004248 [Pleurodeles waltl]